MKALDPKIRIKEELLEKFSKEQKSARNQVKMAVKLKGHEPQSPLNKLFRSNVQNLRETTRRINSLKKMDAKIQSTTSLGSLLKLKVIKNGRVETKLHFIAPCKRITGMRVSLGKYEEVVILSEDSKTYQKIQGARTGEKFILEDNVSVEILKIS